MTGIRLSNYSRTPWSNRITFDDSIADGKSAIVNAHLDWTVEKQRLFTSSDGINVVEIPKYKAVVRQSDQTPLGVVSNVYQPIQNTEAFELMDNLVRDGKIKYHTAGTTNNGRRVWLLGKIGESEVVPNDVMDKYLFLFNTHDGSGSLKVILTNIRVICANMIRALLANHKGEGFSIRHTTNAQENIRLASEIFDSSMKKFKDFDDFTKKLASIQLDSNMWDEFTKTLIPDPPKDKQVSQKLLTTRSNARNKLTELFESGTGQDIPGVAGTAWAALNAITEYANYFSGARGADKQEKRFESSLFGSGARLVDKATTQLIKMAA